jgi:hypothetical protein
MGGLCDGIPFAAGVAMPWNTSLTSIGNNVTGLPWDS